MFPEHPKYILDSVDIIHRYLYLIAIQFTYDSFCTYRRKNRWELTKISAAVMGIEFSYAAETAFVSPTLLKIGE